MVKVIKLRVLAEKYSGSQSKNKPMNRREILRSGAFAGFVTISGCIGDTNQLVDDSSSRKSGPNTDQKVPQITINPNELEGYISPEENPSSVPESLTCEESEHGRVATNTTSPAYGEVEAQTSEGERVTGFALRIDTLEISPGDSFSITLTNISNVELLRGNSSKFSLELRTEAGWEEIRVWTAEPRAYPDEAVVVSPGDGYVWEFDWQDDAFGTDSMWEDRMEVCPAPQEGRYRFTYWGVLGNAVAVEFDVRN